MSDGSDQKPKTHSQSMAAAIVRIENVLKARAERVIKAAKKDPKNDKKSDTALDASQDYYYFTELVDLMLKLNRENENLHQALLTRIPEPKKKESN